MTVQDELLDTDGDVLSTTTYGPMVVGGVDSNVSGKESGSGGTSSASGCRRLTVSNRKRTALGLTAFRFVTWTEWCWTRSTQTVRVVKKGHRLEDVDPLFSWQGITAKEFLFYDYGTNDGHPKSAYKHYRQGHFENCVGPVCQSFYPENTLRSYYNGTWAWSTDD